MTDYKFCRVFLAFPKLVIAVIVIVVIGSGVHGTEKAVTMAERCIRFTVEVMGVLIIRQIDGRPARDVDIMPMGFGFFRRIIRC